jgi:hypothetical protein
VTAPGHASPVTTREKRREQNQTRFREANERLHDAVEDQAHEVQPVPFLCECADSDCLGTVNVLLGEWEAVASQPNHFLIEAGHQRSEGEEVVGWVGAYEVARKPD